MKWTTTILFLLALGCVVAVGAMVSRQSSRTPADFFRSIEERMASGRYDKEQTLANLDIALDSAVASGDDALCTKIRLARGRLLLALGAYEQARADLAQVLESQGGDRTIERLMVEIDLRANDFSAGLARVERMIAADPTWSEGPALLGDLHKRASQRALEECLSTIDATLVADEAEPAKALVLRAAAWDPEDPRRVALAHDLRPYFGASEEARLQSALDAAHASSEHLAQARRVLADSLRDNFQPRAFSNLVELYRRAGRSDLALELALCVLRIPELSADEPTMTFVIRELKAQARLRYAAELSTVWLNARHGGSPALMAEICEVLFRMERWRPLAVAAQSLRAAGNGASEFYLGFTDIASGQLRDGRFKLQRFIAEQSPEPFPRARARAWLQIAYASRALEETHVEREALEGAVTLDPSGDGPAWLRLARLQHMSARGGVVQPELRWARGMSLLPQRTEELLSSWHDLGQRELATNGVDLDLVRRAIAEGRAWNPTEEASPYERYTLAKVYLEAGDLERASSHAQRLLELVPGFLPGLDLELELAQQLGRVEEFVQLFIQRLKLVGPDAKSAEILRLLKLEALPHRQLAALMEFDPNRAGRLIVSRALAARGEKRRALTILENLGLDQLAPDAVRLAARLHLDLGEPQIALDLLVPIARGMTASMSSLDMFLEAAMACHDHERVDQMAAVLASAPKPSPEVWLTLADRMLAGGSAAAADRLLARLDEDADARSGIVIARRATAALVRGDLDGALAFLERAEAFDTAGSAELVALLACLHDDRLSELAARANALRESGFNATTLQLAVLDLLSGRTEAAATAIALALRNDPRQALWQLVAAAHARMTDASFEPPAYFGQSAQRETELFFGGADSARDLRRELAILLAVQTPLVSGWARTELSQMSSDTHGHLWPALFTAVLAQSNGELLTARRAVEDVLVHCPDFGPAWDLLEIVAPQHPSEPRASVLLRMRRLAALGDLSGTVSERLLDEARILQLKGDLAGALTVARAAAEEDPQSGDIQWKLGQLLWKRGEYTSAIDAYGKACAALAPGSNLASTGEFLTLLQEAARTTPPAIDPRARALALERLLARHPDDPRVVVAQARMDMELDPAHPALALARAYARFDSFHAAHRWVSIESLAPGVSATWVDFLLAVEPDRARAFVVRELELDPGSLDLWALMGRVRAACDDVAGALANFELVLDLAPDHPVLSEYLWILAGRELSTDESRALALAPSDPTSTEVDTGPPTSTLAEYDWFNGGERVRRSDRTLPMRMDPKLGALLTPAQIALIRARATYPLGVRGIALAIEALDSIDPATLAPLERERYAFLLAQALIARGKPDDLARAHDIASGLEPSVTDPFRRDLARALAALAASPAADPTRVASLR